MDFSDIYLKAEQRIMVRKADADSYKDIDSFNGKTIAVQKNTTQEKIAQGSMPGVSVTSMEKIPLAVLELTTNKEDGVVIESTVAQPYLIANPDLVLCDAELPEDVCYNDTAIAVPKSNEDFLELINETIKECQDAGLIDQWIDEYSSIAAEQKEDPLHRRNAMALLKGGDGTERDTIMLHGHIDTVDVDDFGRYKPYAFDCDKLAEVFRDAELPEEARRDLESGDYLFGRGACDMKGGDAVFLVLAKHLAEQAEKLHGNLLLSFNPVEETLHRGIIEELPLLRKLQEQHNLTFRLAINNDFICPMYAGDTTRYVYTGAVGKLLPMFYIIGRETHVAQCFEGFSPDLIAAELTRIIDRNPDFCDGYNGEYTLPPTVLKMQDLKPHYNVQTPHTAAVYFNYFVHNRQLTEIMAQLKNTARTALNNVMQSADERYRSYCEISGNRYSSLIEKTQIIDYRELCLRAREPAFLR